MSFVIKGESAFALFESEGDLAGLREALELKGLTFVRVIRTGNERVPFAVEFKGGRMSIAEFKAEFETFCREFGIDPMNPPGAEMTAYDRRRPSAN